MNFILSFMILFPALGAMACLLFKGPAVRWFALAVTLIEFALGIYLWLHFQIGGPRWQFQQNIPLFGRFNWALGIDGIALMLIELSVFLMPICILASWESIKDRVSEFMLGFLLMEALMIGSFCAQDLFLFYILFEASLIPMYFIIGIWGGSNRIYASYKFFLYTLLGSVLMLIAMMWMGQHANTTDIPALMAYNFTPTQQNWLWLAFFVSFAVKLPMWPMHTWLPDAHVQAPTSGSVLLAGVLVKMGGYGFVRFSLPMFPAASVHFSWLVFSLAMIAMVYTSLIASLIAFVQSDMKKLIAYSTVAHMAFVSVGIFSFTQQGIEGALIVMLSHGLVSSALFLCVGVVYDRLHTREISRYSGLSDTMPKYALLFMIFMMASVGLPGTGGFVGEFLALLGVYHANSWVGAVSTSGIILGAVYMLYLYRCVLFGISDKPDAKAMPDLSAREMLILVPVAAVVLWMGVYPESFMAPMRSDVTMITQRLASSATASDSALSFGELPSAKTGGSK